MLRLLLVTKTTCLSLLHCVSGFNYLAINNLIRCYRCNKNQPVQIFLALEKKFMKRKDVFTNLIFVIAIAAGCFIGKFWGGVITGGGASILIVATIGKHVANKAASRINKTIRDHIVKHD